MREGSSMRRRDILLFRSGNGNGDEMGLDRNIKPSLLHHFIAMSYGYKSRICQIKRAFRSVWKPVTISVNVKRLISHTLLSVSFMKPI